MARAGYDVAQRVLPGGRWKPRLACGGAEGVERRAYQVETVGMGIRHSCGRQGKDGKSEDMMGYGMCDLNMGYGNQFTC